MKIGRVSIHKFPLEELIIRLINRWKRFELWYAGYVRENVPIPSRTRIHLFSSNLLVTSRSRWSRKKNKDTEMRRLVRKNRVFEDSRIFHLRNRFNVVVYSVPIWLCVAAYPGNVSTETSEREKPYRHRLFFPVEKDLDRATVDHATLRLLLHGPTTDQYYSQSSELDVLLYLGVSSFPRRSIRLIDRTRIRSEDWRNSKWLELDATFAVSSWIEAPLSNLGLELEFLLDGETVTRTFSSPVLNVFTATPFASTTALRRKRSSPEQVMSLHRGRRTKCKGEGKKCCRHELTVMFKDLKGFEFIVYPKTFDAGYCKGRCPPRYNPAHHHALLQSLLWKEDRKKVPKPCCAPSKLDQLMIVYFDENNSTRLKVSDWKNIQVLECACS